MTIVRFGDVVRDVKVNVDRNNNPYEYYVAGDHMETENLKIQNRGRFATDDVGPAFIRIFKPGQILYGSRRTYLKKVAVADFDGITANTTFVLETRDESILLQKLLPFIMLSDKFTKYSIKHSKGSTNPYILFSDLAKYEFDLPSLEEQKRLAEILWAAENLKESYLRLLTASRDIVSSHFYEMFGNPFINERNWDFKPLTYVSSIISGSTPKTDVAEYWDGDIKWVTPAELSDDSFIITDTLRHITNEGVKATSSLQKLPIGTVLLSSRAPIGKVALCGVEMYCNQGFKNFICSDRLNPIYLFSILKMNTNYLQNLGSGSTFKEISKSVISEMMIIVPPIELQNEYAQFIMERYAFEDKLKDTIESIKGLKVSIITHALEGS